MQINGVRSNLEWDNLDPLGKMSYFLSLHDIIFETSDTFDPYETTVEV